MITSCYHLPSGLVVSTVTRYFYPSTLTRIRRRILKIHSSFFNAAKQYASDARTSTHPSPIHTDTPTLHSHTAPEVLSLLFVDLQDGLQGHGHVVRLLFHSSPPASSAVRITHDWEFGKTQLTRAHFPRVESPDNVRVNALVPSIPLKPASPFTPRDVQSLAFDEVMGRVCAGLYDGTLDYIRKRVAFSCDFRMLRPCSATELSSPFGQ